MLRETQRGSCSFFLRSFACKMPLPRAPPSSPEPNGHQSSHMRMQVEFNAVAWVTRQSNNFTPRLVDYINLLKRCMCGVHYGRRVGTAIHFVLVTGRTHHLQFEISDTGDENIFTGRLIIRGLRFPVFAAPRRERRPYERILVANIQANDHVRGRTFVMQYSVNLIDGSYMTPAPTNCWGYRIATPSHGYTIGAHLGQVLCTRCDRFGHTRSRCNIMLVMCRVCGVFGHNGRRCQLLKRKCRRCTRHLSIHEPTVCQTSACIQQCLHCHSYAHERQVCPYIFG